jgi:hypothetical protein
MHSRASLYFAQKLLHTAGLVSVQQALTDIDFLVEGVVVG